MNRKTKFEWDFIILVYDAYDEELIMHLVC